MKKIILGITAVALGLTMTACGTSANDAAVKSLSNQLDDTSNTIADLGSFNPSDISMTKESLSALATQDENIYESLLTTQASLLNEEYYKADILSQAAKIKSCLSKDTKLSKAQIWAVKDLTTNLQKYTNSVSYTESELNTAVKSVSSMKKNASKNSDKIKAKLNRIACNSNTRSAYYENIINTLNNLEQFLCCDECNTETEDNVDEENSTTQASTKNSQKTENQTRNNNLKRTGQCLPINIDTYAPMNRNIDTVGYNRMYNQMGRNGYGAGYGYNYMGAYSNAYNTMPGAYPNGIYGNGIYGYNRAYYPLYPYQNMAYNSNNINRMAYGAVPVAELDTTGEQRLEDFEDIKNGELQKIEQDDKTKTQNSVVTISLENVGNKSKKTVENEKDAVQEKTEEGFDNVQEKVENLSEKAVSASAREVKKVRKTGDNRSAEEIQKDLDQPIIAH